MVHKNHSMSLGYNFVVYGRNTDITKHGNGNKIMQKSIFKTLWWKNVLGLFYSYLLLALHQGSLYFVGIECVSVRQAAQG